MKKIWILFVVLMMTLMGNSQFAQAAQKPMGMRHYAKMLYVPKEEISLSESVPTDSFAISRNTRKNAVWKNTDDFLNDCSTDYAFLQLENKNKEFEKKTLYIEILNALTEFYNATDHDITQMDFSGEKLYCIGVVPYLSSGLSDSEAFDVFMRVLADHPLFYFAEETLVQDGFNLYLIASDEFYEGNVRREYSEKIKSEITGLDSAAKKLSSNYEIVKYVHDLVIDRVHYAFEEGTDNPKDNGLVHSIAGYVSDTREVVCDGYTETIAAMLNYLDTTSICAYGWGVKQGDATSKSTAHAWNVVKLGNEKYYGVDATWDDTESGKTYDFFCLGRSFFDTHSTIQKDQQAVNSFVYDLPELAEEDFSGEDVLLKTEDPEYTVEANISSTGEYHGFSYNMNQNGTIEINGYQGNEKIVKVPSDIKGHRVVSITECFNYNDLIEEIELPDTINQIGFVGYACNKLKKLTINSYNPGNAEFSAFIYGDGMFGNCQNLNTIIVNENENLKTFWAEDNVLYFGEGDNISLVLYPAGKTDSDYHFRYSMTLGSSFQNNTHIRNVVFEEKIKDSLQNENEVVPPSHVFYHCTNLESVTLQKGAPTVMADWFDGCISLKSFTIPDTVTSIGSMMFNGCQSLKEIILPPSVAYIGGTAFQDCSALESCTIYNDNIAFEQTVFDGKEHETIWNGCNKVVLYCNPNSNTEKYAKKFNIIYAPIGGKVQENKVVQLQFDPNGGTVSIPNKTVAEGVECGSLPSPTRKSYLFIGWYNEKAGGTKITESTKIDGNITLYAHWKKVTVKKLFISSVKKRQKKQIIVKWKKISEANGYRISYALDKRFKKGKKSITCASNKYSKTIGKLKKNRTYYIKVQAYKIDSAGNKIYGSCKKAIKINM